MSTIKVDTYLTRGGASEIAIDKLKGASSAGSMLVVGEGGTNTTNLQQGLLKCWINYATDGSAEDSLNISSTIDSGTAGITTINISNNMNNSDYVFLAGGSNYYYQNCTATLTTSAFPCYTSVVNGSVADAKGYVAAAGDLS